MCVAGFYICLLIMAALIVKIFSCENAIIYNGVKYPVFFDYKAGRVRCAMFGGVARKIRRDNKYNVFGVICEVI